jgi:hypothetical protein
MLQPATPVARSNGGPPTGPPSDRAPPMRSREESEGRAHLTR